MEMQNITLSVPKSTLRKVKMLAVQRNTSISGLLRDYLEKILEEDEIYTRAMQRQFAMMERGPQSDEDTAYSWTRDDLHNRNE